MEYQVFCNKKGHDKQQIAALCCELNCKEQRSCCARCILDDHSGHFQSIQKLDNLKIRYSKQNKPNRLLDELRSRITKLLHLFDSIISDTYLIYPETMNLTNLNQFGERVSSQSKTINYDKIKGVINHYTLLIDQIHNQIETRWQKKKAIKLKTQGNKKRIIGDYDEALDLYNQSLEIFEQDDECLNEKGLALYERKRYDEAIECYDKAIQIQPNDSRYYYNKGVVLSLLKRFNEAIACFDKAIQIQPNGSGYYYNKGVILSQLKRYEEAIACYNNAIQIQPNGSGYYYNKGVVLGLLKKYDEAINCYDKAIQIKPNDSRFYSNKGNALSFLQRYDEAIECFEKAIQIKPSSNYYNNQAQMLEQMGQKQAAYEKYQQALMLDQQNQTAIDGINRLKQLNIK